MVDCRSKTIDDGKKFSKGPNFDSPTRLQMVVSQMVDYHQSMQSRAANSKLLFIDMGQWFCLDIV